MQDRDYPYHLEVKDFKCNVCSKPIDKKGVCSQKCLEIDMR